MLSDSEKQDLSNAISTDDHSLQQAEDNYVYVIIDLLILACCMRLFDY